MAVTSPRDPSETSAPGGGLVGAGMPVQGMPVSRDAQGCLTGIAGSRGMSPAPSLAMAGPLPPSACPLPAGAASCGSPRPGSLCCSLHTCEAVSRAGCHTPKQQFLSLLFFSPSCLFFLFCLQGSEISSNNSSSSSSTASQSQLMPQAWCHHLLCWLKDFGFSPF